MTTRIDRRFTALKDEGRAALVTFLMAGDPDFESSLAIISALPAAGADVIEIGMPFTDPMADGPAIQAAGLRALKSGQTMIRTLQLVRTFRANDTTTPIVLMGYYTLCLSCVSLCPSGALADNPDMPQLRFQEDACLQCGICANICPETAITLEPRLNLADQALTQVVLHEEEPFACVECGALFGVRSTVEKVMEKLGGVHSMYQNPKAVRMIQMCDSCRVTAQYNSENNPFSGGERPRIRTTDDDLKTRRDH